MLVTVHVFGRMLCRTAMAGNRLKMVLTAVHTEKLTLQLLSYLSTPDQIRQLSAAFYGHATPPGTEWITKAAFVNTLMVRTHTCRLVWAACPRAPLFK
jgi:hypothetical protein